MKCPHCLGFMVIDACLNMEGDRNKVWIGEWRCLRCGEFFDPRTLENRALQRQTWQWGANRGGGSLSFQLTGK
jgi:hypothetical protein